MFSHELGKVDSIWGHHRQAQALSPRILLASWMSLGMIVTRLAWMAQRLVSSNSPTRYASAASCNASTAWLWNRRSACITIQNLHETCNPHIIATAMEKTRTSIRNAHHISLKPSPCSPGKFPWQASGMAASWPKAPCSSGTCESRCLDPAPTKPNKLWVTNKRLSPDD